MTVMLLFVMMFKCQCHQPGGEISQNAFSPPAMHWKHLVYPYTHIAIFPRVGEDLRSEVCSFKWQALAAVICVKVRLQGAGVGARSS